MKKLIATLTAVALCAAVFSACGGSSSSQPSSVSSDTTVSSEAASSEDAASSGLSSSEPDGAAGDAADTAKLEAIVSSIEAVNEVPNTRALIDFDLENDLELTMENIVAHKGDVTNDQADCALVLALQVKDGTADAVKAELEGYKERISSNLYAEFADKVAKAQDSRIVVSGNYVVMVIAGVNGPDYAAIDTAIEQALA